MWDVYAIRSVATGTSTFPRDRIFVDRDLPLDEVLFFIVIPVCTILRWKQCIDSSMDWRGRTNMSKEKSHVTRPPAEIVWHAPS